MVNQQNRRLSDRPKTSDKEHNLVENKNKVVHSSFVPVVTNLFLAVKNPKKYPQCLQQVRGIINRKMSLQNFPECRLQKNATHSPFFDSWSHPLDRESHIVCVGPVKSCFTLAPIGKLSSHEHEGEGLVMVHTVWYSSRWCLLTYFVAKS